MVAGGHKTVLSKYLLQRLGNPTLMIYTREAAKDRTATKSWNTWNRAVMAARPVYMVLVYSRIEAIYMHTTRRVDLSSRQLSMDVGS